MNLDALRSPAHVIISSPDISGLAGYPYLLRKRDNSTNASIFVPLDFSEFH